MYNQISLFADQDTALDEDGRKIKWNIRDHAKKLSGVKFTDTYNRRCIYEIYEKGKPPYCQAAKMAIEKNRIKPDECNCGTLSCPYFMPINKEN